MNDEKSPIADVMLLLEGTYPYRMGGVATWMEQIIKGLPELTFYLGFIGTRKEDYPTMCYQIPPNVIGIKEIFLHERLTDEELKPAPTPEKQREVIYNLLESFYFSTTLAEQASQFWPIIDAINDAKDNFTLGNLIKDPEAWDLVRRTYEAFTPEESFIDFFWAVRLIHLPFWQLWRGVRDLPPARAYHSVSTGYAGILGCMASYIHKAPFFLTEHGIYTKERVLEISRADWIYEDDTTQMSFSDSLGKLKWIWIGLFKLLGKIAYDKSVKILTLFEDNALTQIELGADSNRIQIVPNGIIPKNFDGMYQQVRERRLQHPDDKIVGFVGRVVPIKDVKTLIRSAGVVCRQCPNTKFLIAGPYAEDPAYFEECTKIVKMLNLDENVIFMGPQKLRDVLPKIDVLVLTSISEGLPLVMLEAMAAGIPMVATDVGACRELIFGRTAEDKALGACGRITPMLSPAKTAQALSAILQDNRLWNRMGEAGRRRVDLFYTMDQMLTQYRSLYNLGKVIPAGFF